MTVSDFELHAYVDGELTGERLDKVSHEILSAEQLLAHVCDLQTLKQLSRQAYDTVLAPDQD